MNHLEPPVDLVADVAASLARVEALPPVQRAQTAHALWHQVLDIQSRVAALRRSGVRELRADYSLSEVGELLAGPGGKAMSASRVKQIESGIERKPKGGN